MGIQDIMRNHPAIGGFVGGATIGAGTTYFLNIIGNRRKKSKTSTRRKTTRTRRKTSTTKRKKRSTYKRKRAKAFRGANPKRIYKTKNGQPYIKLKSGKARFIKKSTASNMRKRKGGFR